MGDDDHGAWDGRGAGLPADHYFKGVPPMQPKAGIRHGGGRLTHRFVSPHHIGIISLVKQGRRPDKSKYVIFAKQFCGVERSIHKSLTRTGSRGRNVVSG